VRIDSPEALIDTNVILDIVGGDTNWSGWSSSALAACKSAFINPMVFTELCYLQPSVEAVKSLLGSLQIAYEETPPDALFLAAQAFKAYRSRGGAKSAPLPDFFIGAHAVVQGVPIMTRDVARYRSYFPTVTLVTP